MSKRKGVEDSAIQLFGKDLNKSIVAAIGSAGNGLLKGNLTGYRKLMAAVPDSRKQDVAVQMLDELLTAGS